QQIKAAATRHLNVEKQQARSESMRLLDGLLDIGRFADDLHPGVIGEQASQFAPRQWLVIDNECFHGSHGIQTRAIARSGREISRFTLARGPKSSSRRCAQLCNPMLSG